MRDDKGRWMPGPDQDRHELTAADRRKGGQAAWLKAMEDRPWLLGWLQRRIDRTARPGTVAAYKARRGCG